MRPGATATLARGGHEFCAAGLSSHLTVPQRRSLALLSLFAVGFDYRLSAGSGPTLAVLEVVAFSGLFVWFLDLVWNQRLVMKETLAAARQLRWVAVYFSWAFLTVWPGFTRSTENLFAFRNLFPSLVICFLVLAHVRERRDVILCLWAYLCGVIVNVVLAVAQKVLGYPYPNGLHAGALIKMDLEGQFITNTPAGFFVHPNGLAVFLIPAVILVTCGWRIGLFSGWGGRMLQWVLLAATTAALYVTYAKGALLWVGFGVVIGFSPAWARRRIGWLSAAVLSVIPLILFIGTDPFDWKLRTLNSMFTRFEIWNSAFRAMAVDPYVLAFGNGFQAIYLQTLRLSELPYLNAHNNVLNQVIFFGLPALAFYLLSLWALLRQAGQAIRQSEDNKLLVCLVAVVVALFGEHFFEPVLDSVTLQAEYYAFFALVLALAKTETATRFRAPQ